MEFGVSTVASDWNPASSRKALSSKGCGLVPGHSIDELTWNRPPFPQAWGPSEIRENERTGRLRGACLPSEDWFAMALGSGQCEWPAVIAIVLDPV